MVATLKEALSGEFINITPHADTLRTFLTFFAAQTESFTESGPSLTSEEAQGLLKGLNDQQICFAVSKDPSCASISVEYPRFPVTGSLEYSQNNTPQKRPVCAEGIVITIGQSASIDSLLKDPDSVLKLKEAYTHHTEVPYESPYEEKGKDALEEIATYFELFVNNPGSPERLYNILSANRPDNFDPTLYTAYYAYTHRKDKYIIVSRYTPANRHVEYKDPRHHFFPNSPHRSHA